MEWFYARNGQQVGPVSIEHLKQLLASGQVSRRDKVWREGLSDWLSAGEVPELVAGMGSSYPPPPPISPAAPGYTPGWVPPASSRPAQIESYLVHSIIAAFLCFTPLAIVAIVFAAQVDKKVHAGDLEGAQKSANTAKMLLIVNVGLYLLFSVGVGSAIIFRSVGAP